jgi:hypothetical protein
MARNQGEQTNDVANPGSALGEAVGALLEAEIHRILKPLAKRLISTVEGELRKSLQTALDESIPRELDSVTLVIRSNYGETYRRSFHALDQAINFMRSFDEERDMDNSGAPSLLMEE